MIEIETFNNSQRQTPNVFGHLNVNKGILLPELDFNWVQQRSSMNGEWVRQYYNFVISGPCLTWLQFDPMYCNLTWYVLIHCKLGLMSCNCVRYRNLHIQRDQGLQIRSCCFIKFIKKVFEVISSISVQCLMNELCKGAFVRFSKFNTSRIKIQESHCEN